MTLDERFWSKVDKRGPWAGWALGRCWVWNASLRADGYGQFYLAGKLVKAYRVAYELAVGPIPTDEEAGYRVTLDHLCRNRACVNPKHLEAVSHGENIKRGNIARAAVRRTCRRGHPFDDENTIVRDGKRTCRTCKRDNERKRYDPQKRLDRYHRLGY